MALAQVLRFITTHPVNRQRATRGLVDFVAWQVRSRMLPGPHECSWVGGTRFLARRGETGITGNIYTGLHEFEDMAYTLHALRPDSLFVDVGANSGSYTLLAAGAARCRAVAIEPVPEVFARLQQNLSINGLGQFVEPHNVAIGACDGQVEFTSSLDSMNHVVAPGEGIGPTVRVPMRTLDSVLRGRAPDVVKIDVEGFESAVLEGGAAAIAKATAVLVELNGSGSRYGTSDASVAARLFDAGHRTYRYWPFERRLEPTGYDIQASGNTLFIRDEALAMHRVRSAHAFEVKGQTI